MGEDHRVSFKGVGMANNGFVVTFNSVDLTEYINRESTKQALLAAERVLDGESPFIEIRPFEVTLTMCLPTSEQLAELAKIYADDAGEE